MLENSLNVLKLKVTQNIPFKITNAKHNETSNLPLTGNNKEMSELIDD